MQKNTTTKHLNKMKKENKIELEKAIKNGKTIFNVLVAIIVTTITILLFSS